VKERASLKPGEYVVHLEYGIGRYRGLEVITVQGMQRECLLLEYAQASRPQVKKIFLVHGEQRGAAPLMEKLREAGMEKVYFPALHTTEEV